MSSPTNDELYTHAKSLEEKVANWSPRQRQVTYCQPKPKSFYKPPPCSDYNMALKKFKYLREQLRKAEDEFKKSSILYGASARMPTREEIKDLLDAVDNFLEIQTKSDMCKLDRMVTRLRKEWGL